MWKLSYMLTSLFWLFIMLILSHCLCHVPHKVSNFIRSQVHAVNAKICLVYPLNLENVNRQCSLYQYSVPKHHKLLNFALYYILGSRWGFTCVVTELKQRLEQEMLSNYFSSVYLEFSHDRCWLSKLSIVIYFVERIMENYNTHWFKE